MRPTLAAALRTALLPGTTLLAWRNLVHDRARFAVTLIGIVFAVVLMGAQLGLLVGFAKTASTVVDHADADLWVSALGVSNVDISGRIPERRRFEALSVPGVAAVDAYVVQFAVWRKPDGGTESVIMVGFDQASGRGGPWSLSPGSTLTSLRIPDGVLIDRLYMHKLGVTRVGQVIEINNQRARVVGLTEGIRTFTQSPYVFTTYARAQRLALLRPGEASYLLVKLKPGADPDRVRRALSARLPFVDVMTVDRFARRTAAYWLITTGAGSALVLAAVLGLVVGIVIVGQTLYASTVDHLSEYATLRAMGATNRYLYRIIGKQAMISAVLGFGIGIGATIAMVMFSRSGNVAMALPVWLILSLAVLTFAMCLLGAVISIRRVMTIDPTQVFQ